MPIPFSRSLAKNNGKVCDVPGCGNPRDRIGRWCKHHANKVYNYGHPLGRIVWPTEYAQEKAEVKAFVDQHMSHPGVQAALVWLQDWLDALLPDDPILAKQAPPCIDVFQRLKAHGVTPADILIEATALYHYSMRYPGRLPDDGRLSVAISRAVIKLAPQRIKHYWRSGQDRYEKIKPSDLKTLGKRMRDTIGLLMANVSNAINQVHNAKANLRLALGAPFTGDYAPTPETSKATNVSPTYLFNQPASGRDHKETQE